MDKSNQQQEALLFEKMYIGLLKRSVSAMRLPEDCRVMMLGACALDVDAGGQLIGFNQCIQRLHKNVACMLTKEWQRRFVTPITRECLSFYDVASFVLTYARQASMYIYIYIHIWSLTYYLLISATALINNIVLWSLTYY